MDQNQRPRYYEGQYLGADDLAGAIGYGRVAAARHTLGAHTWGIAMGLELVERALPSGAVQITLVPGLAWDGYGRAVVVSAPTVLGAAQFSNLQSVTPPAGLLVKVWLRYDETTLRGPAPGFETCRTNDQHGRIAESFAIEVGEPPGGAHGSLVIAGRSSDARAARTAFDPAAPPVYDESVPHQTFPDGTPPEWWIPIGYVRWQRLVAGQPGRLIARNDQPPPPAQPDSDVIRAFRHYVGVVADTIGAADGVIRLRDRWRDPDPALTHFQTPRATVDQNHPPVNDLVWIEGHLRVLGDVRVAGGRLELRDPSGSDGQVPLALRRVEPNARGGKDLQLVLGTETTPTGLHAFAIGPARRDAATGALAALDPRLVVRDDGRVGIGTATPGATLQVQGSLLCNGAVTLNGHTAINGNLAVTGVKAFRIPHPGAPAARDLVHAALEGPEAGVYYRGEARLVDGSATVCLPDYFEALTGSADRSVLVTPIWDGAGPVSALAASRVRAGRFTVRAILGDNPSQPFWWEVKAVRADLPRLTVAPDRRGTGETGDPGAGR